MAGDRLQNATYSRLFDRKRVISVTPDIQFPRRIKEHLPVSDVLKTTSKLLNELMSTQSWAVSKLVTENLVRERFR